MRLRMLCGSSATVESSHVIISALIGISLILLSIVLMINRQSPSHLSLSQTRDFPLYDEDGGVILYGDSLIHRSCYFYDLIGKLSNRTDYRLGYTDQGVNGDTIHDIRARLPDVLDLIDANEPTAVFLFWDSDVSDIDEDNIPYFGPMYLRYRYAVALRFVIRSLLSKNVYLAVAGPGLLPLASKTDMLESYKAINIQICGEFGLDYIDLRTKFLEAEANNNETVTVDGEHLNEIGVSIVTEEFSECITKWQTSSRNYSISEDAFTLSGDN